MYSNLMTYILLIFVLSSAVLSADLKNQTGIENALNSKYDLSKPGSNTKQYFNLTTELVNYAPDGKRQSKDIYKLSLRFIPAENGNKEQYECLRFSFQFGDSAMRDIPSLKNMKYTFFSGIDEKNNVFGIDHAAFENLTGSNGVPLPPDKSYHIYNAFIDFHGFCNVFAGKTADGKGIQDLKKIGEKIVHEASYSKPPTHLGKNFAEGSYFQNGKIILGFKGLSRVNNKSCALVSFDSGESSFKMINMPMPNFEIVTNGSSHYWGDIYKDLQSGWVQKVEMHEIVISQTKLPVEPKIINAAIERYSVIVNVSADQIF